MRKSVVASLAGTVLGLGIFYAAAVAMVARPSLLAGPVAIESGADFDFKLGRFARYPGPKIALIGDSLVYGRSLKPLFGRTWKTYTLDRKLEDCLGTAAGRPVSVWNFALDGAVPADFVGLRRKLLSAGAGLVVFDINLRSLSADFASADDAQTRGWLRAAGTPAAVTGSVTAGWPSLRLIKAVLLDINALEFIDDGRVALLRLLGKVTARPSPADDRTLLLKLRGRYRTVAADTQTPQFQALRSLLGSEKTLAFLALEHPGLSHLIIPPERRNEVISALAAAGRGATSDSPPWVQPEPISPDNYIDFLHVDDKGYQVYSQSICRVASPFVR